VAARAKAAEAARVQAERKAEAGRAEAQAEALAAAQASEQKAALAKQSEGALGACCDAIARRGFEERSMSDMAAKRVCGELVAKGDSLEAARPLITGALEGRPLPGACAEPK